MKDFLNWLKDLFDPKNMKKGGRNELPKEGTQRPAPPKRIIHVDRAVDRPDRSGNEPNDLVDGLMYAEMASLLFNDIEPQDNPALDDSYYESNSDSTPDFDGGDFGGGGAGGDW
jgi:hypothetical protein